MKKAKSKGPNKLSLKQDKPGQSTGQSYFKKKIYKKKKDLGKKKMPLINGTENNAIKEPARKFSSNWEAFLKEAKDKDSSATRKEENHHAKPNNRSKKRSFPKERKLIKLGKELTETIDQKEIWFDDVDIEDIEHATGKKVKLSNSSQPSLEDAKIENAAEVLQDTSVQRITKYLAIDCEMVGVGIDGKDSMLARVSLVNSFGETIYDKFVAPMQKVVDYRTEVSGVRPEDLKGALQFKDVQKEVADLTNGRILIGHAINHDLKVLLLSHPRKDTRDTSTYKPFKKLLKTRYPSLKKLVKEILQIDIQSGEHSSVEDARCTMKVFQLHRKQWEKSLKEKGPRQTVSTTPTIFMGKDSNDSISHRKRKYLERKKKKKEK